MSPFVELMLILAILITAAKTAGYISYRLGQPSVLGELSSATCDSGFLA